VGLSKGNHADGIATVDLLGAHFFVIVGNSQKGFDLNSKKFFDALGLNGTRWQWKLMKWERQLKQLQAGDFSSLELSVHRIILYLNLVLFTLMVIHGLLAGIGVASLFSPPTPLLLTWGGQYWPATLNHGQWWRALTYAYTHGGLIHLGFNMMVLYQVGPLVERELGPARFLVLYTATALTATLAGLFWYAQAPVVGASGALFGLIGFSIVYFHRVGPPAHQLRNFMLQWALFAFVFGLLVGADNAGHFGGAAGGALIGLLLPPRSLFRPALNRLWNALGLCCAAVTLLALGSMLYVIVTG
jgi:membrane associated rhomboid family serine protease